MAMRRKRVHMSISAEDRRLSRFFQAWSLDRTYDLCLSIHDQHVTGVDLAATLRWSRDMVSRLTDDLREAGLVSKRRDGGWMRVTLTTVGVDEARRWAAGLQPAVAVVPSRTWKREAWKAAADVLGDLSRRRILERIAADDRLRQADLMRACALSQPQTSRALERLKAGGFITARRVDDRMRFALNADAIGQVRAWLEAVGDKLEKGAERSAAVVLERRIVGAADVSHKRAA